MNCCLPRKVLSSTCAPCWAWTSPTPRPTQDYMFERPITFQHGDGSTSAGRIDCYKRDHFVLEAKKLQAASHTQSFGNGLLQRAARQKTTPVLCPRRRAARPLYWWWMWAPSSRCMPSSAALAAPTRLFLTHAAARIALADLAKPRGARTPAPHLDAARQPQPRTHQRPGHARSGATAGAAGQIAGKQPASKIRRKSASRPRQSSANSS